MPQQELSVAVEAARSLAWELAAAVVDTLVLPKQTHNPIAAEWPDELPIVHTVVPSDYLAEETSSCRCWAPAAVVDTAVGAPSPVGPLLSKQEQPELESVQIAASSANSSGLHSELAAWQRVWAEAVRLLPGSMPVELVGLPEQQKLLMRH